MMKPRFNSRLVCHKEGLPGWLSSKESTCNTEDTEGMGYIPRSRGSSGGGHGNLLQCSCQKNPMDRGAQQAVVHGGSIESDMTEAIEHARCHKDVSVCLKPDAQPFSPYALPLSPVIALVISRGLALTHLVQTVLILKCQPQAFPIL